MGGDPDAFWRQTPFTYAVFMNGRLAVRADEQQGRLWLAYYTALMTRAKTLPAYDRLTGKKAGKSQSPARIEAEARKLAAFGFGTFIPPSEPSLND